MNTFRHVLLSGSLMFVSAVAGAAGTCPTTPTGTVIPITDFDPGPDAGTVPLVPDAMIQFIQDNNINSIEALMDYFPDHMNKNFSLVEHTQTPGTSSLYQPRIVMFGSDAEFMVNISTDPADPTYNLVDLAYLHDDTGEWEFSQLDFNQSTPVLHKNPASCNECHGTPGKPVWGQYLNWPGVFGDDDAIGNAPETLEPRHAAAFRYFSGNNNNLDRMDNLIWHYRYDDNRAQMLADHRYGFALSVMNMEIGRAVSAGMATRLKNTSNWPDIRHEFTYSLYCDAEKRRAGNQERNIIGQLIANLGGTGNRRDDFFNALGIDIAHDFAIHRMTKDGLDGVDFNVNTDSLYGLLGALLLDDLRKNDAQVNNILLNGPNNYGIWSCPQLGSNTSDVLDFKMTHGWKLKGSARQQVQEAFFDVDMFRIFQVVHDQVEAPLCNYLENVLDARLSDGGNDDGGNDDGDTDDTPVTYTWVTDQCLTQSGQSFVPHLQNNQSVCIDSNGQVYGYIFVPSGTQRLILETGYGSGNTNLYHKDRGYPTASSYDNRSSQQGNHQLLDISNPATNTYHHFLIDGDLSGTSIGVRIE